MPMPSAASMIRTGNSNRACRAAANQRVAEQDGDGAGGVDHHLGEGRGVVGDQAAGEGAAQRARMAAATAAAARAAPAATAKSIAGLPAEGAQTSRMSADPARISSGRARARSSGPAHRALLYPPMAA